METGALIFLGEEKSSGPRRTSGLQDKREYGRTNGIGTPPPLRGAVGEAKIEALLEHVATQEKEMIVGICIFLCAAALAMSLMGPPKTSR